MIYIKNIFKNIWCCFIISLLCTLIILSIEIIFLTFEMNNEYTSFISNFIGYFFVILLLKKLVRKKTYVDIQNKNHINKIIAGTIYIMFMVYPIVYYSMIRLILFKNNTIIPQYIDESQSIIAFIFHLIKNACLIPIMEELLFRKLSFAQLEHINSTIKILLTAALFTLFHVPTGFYIGDVLIAGLSLGFLYKKTANVTYCILAHSAHNLSACIINRLNYERIIPYDFDLYIYPIWLCIVCTIILMATIIIVIVYNKNINSKQEVKK